MPGLRWTAAASGKSASTLRHVKLPHHVLPSSVLAGPFNRTVLWVQWRFTFVCFAKAGQFCSTCKLSRFHRWRAFHFGPNIQTQTHRNGASIAQDVRSMHPPPTAANKHEAFRQQEFDLLGRTALGQELLSEFSGINYSSRQILNIF